LSNQSGKVVLLEFMWVSCPACDTMIPILKNINSNYDIVILEISVEPLDTFKDLKDYKKNNDVPWNFAKDNNGTLKSAYSIEAAPTFYLVAQNMTVAWGDEKTIRTEINKII
jgi:thiol-disulfide isomerase/thioredoxin